METAKPLEHITAKPAPLRGYVIVLSGTVIWALTGIFIKVLLTTFHMDTLVIAFWRVLLVTGLVLIVLLALGVRHFRIARRDLVLFFFYGLIGVAIHQLVWITSVEYNGAAVATVIIYTSPAIVALFAWRFLHETMDGTKLFALALAITGCALVARVYDAKEIQLNGIGLAAGIGSAFTFATYSLLGRVATQRYSAWTSLFYAFLFGTVLLSVFLLGADLFFPLSFVGRDFALNGLALDGWGALFCLALVTLGGFGMYTIGLTYLPASVASILAAAEPVTTAIVAYFVFGEVLDVPQLFGAALILWGVIMLRPRNGK